MAENPRVPTRMINPGNTMNMSPTVQNRQMDNSRYNQMQGIAQQLLQFSDSFAGAFKAKAISDEREQIKQQKIQEQIKKERIAEQEIVGRTERKRSGLYRQDQLDAMLSPEAQPFYWKEHYEITLKQRNLAHKVKAKKFADKVFKSYNIQKKIGKVDKIPLEKFAAIHLESLRSQNIDEFFSVTKTDALGTNYQEIHPMAAEVLKDKGGIDLSPYYEAIANLDSKQQKESYNATKRQAVQEHVVKDIPPTTHFELMERIRTAQSKFKNGEFFTEPELLNDYVRVIDELLDGATESDDPVFKMLEWIDTSSEGVSVLNSGYGSEKNNVKLLSQDFMSTQKKLRERKKVLEGQEAEKSKVADEQEQETNRKNADQISRVHIFNIENAVTPSEIEMIMFDIQTDIENEEFIDSASNGLTVADLLAKANQKKKDLGGTTTTSSIKDADKDVRDEFNKLQLELSERLKIESKPLSLMSESEILILRDKIRKFATYNETRDNLSSLLVDIVREREIQIKKESDKTEELWDESIIEQNNAQLDIIQGELTKVLQNPKVTKKEVANLQTKLDSFLSSVGGVDKEGRWQNMQDQLTAFVQIRNGEDAVITYEDNGFKEKYDSEFALSEVKAENKDFDEEKIRGAITTLNANKNLLIKDKEKALENYFEALTILTKQGSNKKYVALRKEVIKYSRDKKELRELVSGTKLDKYPDLVKEAKAYIENLDNFDANEKFYKEGKEADVKLYDQRLKEKHKREDRLAKKAEEHRVEELKERRFYDQTLAHYNRELATISKIEDEDRREVRRKEIEREKRKYEEGWWYQKRNRTEAFQKSQTEQRKQDNIDLRKMFQTIAETKAQKQKENDQVAVDMMNLLQREYVLAKSDTGRSNVIKKYKSEPNQKIFNSASLGLKSAMDSFFTNASNRRTQEDRSHLNKETAEKSQQTRTKEAADIVGNIESILASATPNFTEAKGLLSSMSNIQIWNSDNGKLMSPQAVSTISYGKRMEYYGKIRAREIELKDKNDSTSRLGTSAKIHIDLENRIRNFPFDKEENELETDFKKRQEDYTGLFFGDLTINYESGKISKAIYDDLVNDIEGAQQDIEKRKEFMLKTMPYSPIKIYEQRIKDTISKNPGGFYFQLGGAGTFLGAEQHRMDLYSEMITHYKNMVNEGFKNNPEGMKDYTTQWEYVKGLYESMIETTFKDKIQSVNNILGNLTQGEEEEAKKQLNKQGLKSNPSEIQTQKFL